MFLYIKNVLFGYEINDTWSDIMAEKILFSLENCPKCTQTKELMEGRDDIKIETYPHEIENWSEEQLNNSKSYDVFEDLKITAPILWAGGEKIIGYLRVRKCLQDNEISERKEKFCSIYDA